MFDVFGDDASGSGKIPYAPVMTCGAPAPGLILAIMDCRLMDAGKYFKGIPPLTFSRVDDNGAEVLDSISGFEPLAKALGRMPSVEEANTWRDGIVHGAYERWRPILDFGYWCTENFSEDQAPRKFWAMLKAGHPPAPPATKEMMTALWGYFGDDGANP